MTTDDEYKQQVLEPARAAGDQPPEDLRVRYRLREPLRPAEVAAAVKEVRQCWRRARGQLKYRKLIDRLEADHRALVPVFDAAAQGDLGPLQSRLRAAQASTARRRVEAKAWLLDAAGALGLLAPADLEGLAKANGVPVTELGELAAGAGIEVREPDPLPVVSPYQAYPRVREALDVLGHRHLPDFVFAGRAGGAMRVLDGFHAPGARLDAAAVAVVTDRWARHARDSSATHADTVLVALKLMIKQGRLDEFVCYDIAARLRERHRRRASERALLRYATADLGVDEQDARRLVFAIGREAGPEGGGGPAARLRELIDAGEVHNAALLAEALLATAPPDAADRDAAVLVAEVRQRVAEATRLHAEAAASPDPDRAWALLGEALRLVPDLPGAEEQQRRLPPRPVPAAHAAVEESAVLVTWSATPSAAGDIDYQVVRSGPEGRGATEIAVTTELGVRDDRPPANVPVTYAVVARRGAAAAAPATAGPVVVRPEPSEVEVFAGDGVVTGRWRCPPAAARTLVARDGDPVLAGKESFRDRDVRNGTTYRYRLSAVYLDAAGREVATPGVWRTATPTAPPRPITDLAVEPDPVEPGRVLATFAAPAHGTAEIVVLGSAPPWPHGAVVPVSEVLRAGRRVATVPVPVHPPREGLRFQAPTGVVLAVTVAGDTAAIGDHQRHVNLPPPRDLLAERRGNVIMVGFDWPPGVAEVQVTCRLPGTGAERTHIVTKAGYDAQGGLRLAAPEGATVDVAVCSTGLAGGDRVSGAPVTATVPGHCLVRYDLYRTGPPWRRGLVVALTPDQSVRLGRLVLVRSPGKVIPQRAADGETIAAWDDLDLTGPTELAVPAVGGRGGSGGPDGPYWLRCFLAHDHQGAELTDPPVRRLRFS
ncbi:MAG TPA: hypothetical protein VFU43_17040 [Streptosporangiaceae bacterium]|nr:hypothetical protein [Streptosporangiaceae bacterium]